jgi:hypothetical protein
MTAESNVGGSLVLMCGNRTAFTTELAIDTTMQMLSFGGCLLMFDCVVKRIGPTHAFKPIIEAVRHELLKRVLFSKTAFMTVQVATIDLQFGMGSINTNNIASGFSVAS